MNKKQFFATSLVALLAFNTHADSLNDLQKCAATKDSLTRLVCYDQVMKVLNGAQIPQSVVNKQVKQQISVRATEPAKTVDSAAPLRPVSSKAIVVKQATTKDEDFGQEHLAKTTAEKNNEIKEVVFVVKTAKQTARDLWLITFENGQVWKQSDSKYIKLSAGDNVVLSKGMLGAIYLKKDQKNRKIRVKRQK